jgi:pimeloyl-ACP methyl ester carboxylesterase
MKSDSFSSSRLAVFGLLFLALTLSGCTLVRLRQENKEITRTGIVAVQAVGFPTDATVYGLVFKSGKTDEPLGYEAVKSGGVMLFALPVGGNYDVLVFADLNKNRFLDHSEPKGVAVRIPPRSLADPELAGRLIGIVPSQTHYGEYVGVAVPKSTGVAIPIACGEVASVQDKRFSPKTGEDGLWRPEHSLRSGNLGLYFTEPFDPSRTPVIFVHGIGGSPRDFAKLIPALDKKKFQAWFFTYPSGFRLGKASTALSEMISLLRKKHNLGPVHIVAHSMGGLVSRDAILKLAPQGFGCPVNRFVSISTPFGGYEAAASGVRHLRYPVPSWVDLAPGSEFLTNLWKRPMPEPSRHWLIFGYDTKQVPWLTLNNDQVVNLQTALFIPAQEESVKVFGIHKNHENILFSPETAAKVNEFLTEK